MFPYIFGSKGVFPKIGVPQNGWFIRENPIKMDDLGGKPLILGLTSIYIYIYIVEGIGLDIIIPLSWKNPFENLNSRNQSPQ